MVSTRFLGATLAMSLALNGCGSSKDGTSNPPGPGGNAGTGGAGGAGGGSSGSSAGGAGGSPSAGASGAGGSNGGGVPAVSRSAGCGQTAELESGAQTLVVDGLARTFILDLPGDYDENSAYSVVFGFHGRGFSAAEFRSASYGNLLSVAGDDAILVHPEATEDGVELAWDTESQQDLRFFDALLEAVSDGLCIDEARVFATGHSSGGYFTNLLGCQRADVLRAIAPVAGGGPFAPGGGSPSCGGPLSAWIAHAENDQTVLFSNGENSLDHWLSTDDCDENRSESVAPAPCVAYEGCGAGLAVNWCVYESGHDWPSFAAPGIWNFFKGF